MSVENIQDHIAYACECGSVNFALLKSGKIECNKCSEIVKHSDWKKTMSEDCCSTGMSFGNAIEKLKLGDKVARAGWNGKGMWLGYVGSDQWRLSFDAPLACGDAAPLPWIGMKTADNNFVPWLASQTDILANDWCVVAS